MLFAEKESNLINDFQRLETNKIFLVTETDEVKSLVTSILDFDMWAKWVDYSAENITPDFYSDELGLMMEVMRVDDHGFKKKGNIINPTYNREHQIEKELREAGILDMFPNSELHITANTGLPTEQDHNYKYYYQNFKRTVEKHIKHISQYKENHPKHKLIFFVFDESSAYLEDVCDIPRNELIISGKPHMYMFDKAFVDVFRDADIDYFIWFTPYKRFECIVPHFELPKACVYKIGNSLPAEYTYDANKMVSAEK